MVYYIAAFTNAVPRPTHGKHREPSSYRAVRRQEAKKLAKANRKRQGVFGAPAAVRLQQEAQEREEAALRLRDAYRQKHPEPIALIAEEPTEVEGNQAAKPKRSHKKKATLDVAQAPAAEPKPKRASRAKAKPAPEPDDMVIT